MHLFGEMRLARHHGIHWWGTGLCQFWILTHERLWWILRTHFRCLRYFGNSFWTLHFFSFLGSWLKDLSIAVETFGKARHVDAGTSGLQDIQATEDKRHPFRHVMSMCLKVILIHTKHHETVRISFSSSFLVEAKKCPSWHLSPDK